MDFSKIDPRIATRHRAYRKAMESEAPVGSPGDEHVAIAVSFDGPIEPLEAAGFITHKVIGSIAFGDIRIADLERLAELPEVRYVHAESQARPLLDESVPEINVPAVWNGAPSYKGSGVVVGVVDTGIDIFHNCFREPDGGPTRILFLWDQTLPTPNPLPPTAPPYGVEFTAQQINDALGKPDEPFAHQDVNGHGTHVAGTAAGDGTQAGNCHLGNRYLGVAPEAGLIIVKSEFRGRTYVDGVEYIFNKAAGLTRAVVANLSLGSQGGPRDGTTAEEQALDALLPAGSTGKVIVAASGNAAADGLHAHKTVAANGNATMTFKVLANERFRIFITMWYGGSGPPATPGPAVAARLTMSLRAPDGTTVSVTPGNDPPAQPCAGGTVDLYSQLNIGRVGRHQIAIDLAPASQGGLAPGDWVITVNETAGTATDVDCWLAPFNAFITSEHIAASGTAIIRFHNREERAGLSSGTITYTGAARLSLKLTTPDPETTPVVAGTGTTTVTAGNHSVRVVSQLDVPSAGNHMIQFWITADQGKTVDTGAWTLTLIETAGQATTAECTLPEDRPWVEVTDPGGKTHVEQQMPRFVPADRDPHRTVEAPGTAKNVICVGAYDPRDGKLADFSSRGPSIDSRSLPDLTAPGVAITAPKTRARGKPLISDCCLDFYVDKDGTSMAAPHVTGVVALMLQRNKTLDFNAIRDALKQSARPVTGGSVDDWGAGKLDAQQAMGKIVAAPGSGGGGSGGTTITLEDQGIAVPLAAVWPRYTPTPHRIGELQRALSATPSGHLVMALVSKHFDEVNRIVQGNRKVATVWHRMSGPLLLRTVVGWDGSAPPVPLVLGDVDVAAGLQRLLRALARYASPALLGDLRTYEPFVLALPGATLTEVQPTGGESDARPAGHPRDSCT